MHGNVQCKVEHIFVCFYAGYGINVTGVNGREIIILFSMCRHAHSCAFISVIELPRIPAYCPKYAWYMEVPIEYNKWRSNLWILVQIKWIYCQKWSSWVGKTAYWKCWNFRNGLWTTDSNERKNNRSVFLGGKQTYQFNACKFYMKMQYRAWKFKYNYTSAWIMF